MSGPGGPGAPLPNSVRRCPGVPSFGALGWPCHRCRRREPGGVMAMIEPALVRWGDERAEGASAECANLIAAEEIDRAVD